MVLPEGHWTSGAAASDCKDEDGAAVEEAGAAELLAGVFVELPEHPVNMAASMITLVSKAKAFLIAFLSLYNVIVMDVRILIRLWD